MSYTSWQSNLKSYFPFLVELWHIPVRTRKESKSILNLEAYSEPFQASKMEIIANIVNSFLLITIFAKKAILDIGSVLNTPLNTQT